jgi:hypothetical protein
MKPSAVIPARDSQPPARGAVVLIVGFIASLIAVIYSFVQAGELPAADRWPDPVRIFEPFYTTKEKGLGVGLSICRSIIEAYAGQLWATADEGGGSTFEFTLPAHHAAAP